MEPAKVAVVYVKGGLKQSSDANISSAKSVKLSKSVIPHAIASTAVARITSEARGLKNVSNALGSKAYVGGPSSKTMPRAKKAAPSPRKRIIPGIGALAAISSEGSSELSPHGQAPKVQLRAEPRG
jgi:hypothetical protein